MKEELRKQLEHDIMSFIASGGSIKHIKEKTITPKLKVSGKQPKFYQATSPTSKLKSAWQS